MQEELQWKAVDHLYVLRTPRPHVVDAELMLVLQSSFRATNQTSLRSKSFLRTLNS